MDSGSYNTKFYLRDLSFNDNDLLFTYKIIIKRLEKKESIIDLITNTKLPTYEEHVINLKTKFKHLKIMMINSISVGFMPIDKNNFFGMFYDFSQLKLAFKEYNIKLKQFEQTKHYLLLLRESISKGESLFAYISPEHILSNKACKKVFKHIANLYGYKK